VGLGDAAPRLPHHLLVPELGEQAGRLAQVWERLAVPPEAGEDMA
jgi:hypothetical protein